MGRAPCCSKVGLNRGPWTPEEDMLLSKHIEAHGEGNWRALPKAAGLLRCGKSCRLRWVNYLRPNVKRGNISEDEEDLIVMLHALLGNRWSLIAARMPGRTDNEIKNYWNTHLSKKLASKGLDPKTHKPISSKVPSSAMKQPKNNKSSEGATSSSSSAEEQSNEEPQEAWETTMDMDTCSYSTGSCCLVGEEQQNHKEMPVSWRHKQKQRIPVEEQQLNVSLPQRNNKFNCASPSSVLNMYSPSASASNCESPTRTATTAAGTTNSQSSCLSPSSNSSDNSIVLGANSEPNSSSWELPIAASDKEHQQLVDDCPLFEADPEETLQAAAAQQVQMLEFIDEFLCSSSSNKAEEENLFKEELAASSEFWDSLGKIELPEAPALCQSDLWDGLRDLVVAPSSTSSIDPLSEASNASQSCQEFQDNISELLFCA